MKKILKKILVTMVFLSIPFANAAQKIAIVFPSAIMKESPQRERSVKKLDKEFKSRYKKIQSLEKSIKKLADKLKRDAELLSKSDYTKMKRDYEVKVSDYKLKRAAFEEDSRQRQGEEQRKTLKLLNQIIEAIAKKEGYDMILNGEQMIFAKEKYDISDQVIKEMSKK